ncbi:MAG: hypothetical protein ABSA16_05940 [Thermoguttaceae bacterium]
MPGFAQAAKIGGDSSQARANKKTGRLVFSFEGISPGQRAPPRA